MEKILFCFLSLLTGLATAGGLVGDGITDDTTAFRLAVADGGNLHIPRTGDGYVLKGQINCPNDITITSDGATLYMCFEPNQTSQSLFYATCDIKISGLVFDGSRMATCEHVAVRNAIRVTGIANIRDCKFYNMNAAGPVTSSVNHCIRLTDTSRSTIEDCVIDTCSGAGIFVDFSNHVKVLNNTIAETGWYSITMYRDCSDYEIAYNEITGFGAGVRDKGGSISLMSLQGYPPNIRGRVHHNYISGVHNYGAAIDVRSCSYLDIYSNIVDAIYGTNENKSCIRIQTRGSSGTHNGPSSHINIRSNVFIAGDTEQRAVYIDNDDAGSGDIDAGEGYIISGNQCISLDADNHFSSFVMMHGQEGGFNNVIITDNIANGIPDDTPVAIPGLIGIYAKPSAHITNVIIANNILAFLGTATEPDHNGIYIGQYCDDVITPNNILDGFYEP